MIIVKYWACNEQPNKILLISPGTLSEIRLKIIFSSQVLDCSSTASSKFEFPALSTSKINLWLSHKLDLRWVGKQLEDYSASVSTTNQELRRVNQGKKDPM